MKGKNVFTELELQEIYALVNQKQQVSKKDQKTIRKKIRRRKFYWTALSDKKIAGGYKVSDIEKLIAEGKITVLKRD